MNYMTEHAQRRSQQRGISPFILGLIIDFGQCTYRHGAEVYFLDKLGRRKLQRELGKKVYARFEDQLNIYVVLDGSVITVAHRIHRIKH